VSGPSGATTTAPRQQGPSTTAAPTTTVAPVFTGTPRLYREQPIDSWGHDGTAFALEIVGNTVYVGGEFEKAVHHGQSAPRANAMAVDLTTGGLLPFTADTNGPVYGVASDGRWVYLAGDFTTVNGVARQRVARVDRLTGAVDPSFTVSTNRYVRDLLLVGNRLYLVGAFGSVNGASRGNAAAVDAATGAVDPTFRPEADALVNTVAISRDRTKLYLGGNFTRVGSAARPFLAEVDPTTGRAQGPAFPTLTKMVRDLTVRDDGSMVYAGTRMNAGFAFDTTSGKRKWVVKVDGDLQAIVQSNGFVYLGFHDGYQGDPVARLLAANPTTGQVDPAYRPASNGYPGVVTLDVDGRFLVAGGLFSRMGSQAALGLAIFPA
jgi:outer membrane protein assembly factor BamB